MAGNGRGAELLRKIRAGWCEVTYSLLSFAACADLVCHVHLVTDGQCPERLHTAAPGITVVDHREILQAPETSPVFDSHAIGARLHRIPGLSERPPSFDDVFIEHPSGAETFFHGTGIARMPFSPSGTAWGIRIPPTPLPGSAERNVRRLTGALAPHHR